MLFNSYQFLFIFFPAVLLTYAVFGRYGSWPRRVVLLIASFIFYAWWDVRFVALLAGSMLLNFTLGQAIAAAVRRHQQRRADALTALAVGSDLLVLAVFKYTHFFLDNLDAISGTNFAIGTIILPLGISFFTFEQIGFIVDQRRGRDYPVDLLSFAVFVSFFPRLVAGPILRYNEIAPQIESRDRRGLSAEDLAVGLTIFFIGLVKKAVIADGIAIHASPVFASAARGDAVDLFTAWGGALAYTCQLYFDFSGYSDMAIGAARCFGVRLPMNFFSPYKSTSIIEFWRRWHMTLSRFLRDYLYISLGGNRRGPVRRYLNLLITMLLGGLRHGANWTFVAWGGLHGLYLMVNHAWSAACGRNAALAALGRSRIGVSLGFVLTFVAVVIGWVFFRAPDFAAALDILAGMAGRHGAVLPEGVHFALRPLDGVVGFLGIRFGEGSGAEFVATYLWVVAGLSIAWLLPSTQEFLTRYHPVLDMIEEKPNRGLAIARRLVWVPSWYWAAAAALFAFVGIGSITRVSEFLYWQF